MFKKLAAAHTGQSSTLPTPSAPMSNPMPSPPPYPGPPGGLVTATMSENDAKVAALQAQLLQMQQQHQDQLTQLQAQLKNVQLGQPGATSAPPPLMHQPGFGTPGVAQPVPTSQPRTMYAQTQQVDPIKQILAAWNIMFLIDDSTSMSGPSSSDSRISRWQETLELVRMLLPYAVEADTDGVDVCFMNNTKEMNVGKNDDFGNAFADVVLKPSTPMGSRLREILSQYLNMLRQRPSIKPLSLIVVTDGEPNDQKEVRDAIVSTVHTLTQLRYNPNDKLGIMFFQVGNDPSATRFLQYLDDGLRAEAGIADVVDVTTAAQLNSLPLRDYIKKLFLGSIDKDVDNSSSLSAPQVPGQFTSTNLTGGQRAPVGYAPTSTAGYGMGTPQTGYGASTAGYGMATPQTGYGTVPTSGHNSTVLSPRYGTTSGYAPTGTPGYAPTGTSGYAPTGTSGYAPTRTANTAAAGGMPGYGANYSTGMGMAGSMVPGAGGMVGTQQGMMGSGVGGMNAYGSTAGTAYGATPGYGQQQQRFY